MEVYKEINREVILQNQELLRSVSVLKEEIIKLNKRCLMEKEKTQRLKGVIARIITETSEKIVQALCCKYDDIPKTVNSTNKRRSSTSVLNENLSFIANRNSFINRRTQTPTKRLNENIGQKSVETESFESVSRLDEKIIFQARRHFDVDIDSCDSDDDSNESRSSDTSANSNIIPDNAEDECEADITYGDPPAASLSEYSIPLPTINEESSVPSESSEFSTSAIAEENSDILAVSEDENEQSSATNDLSNIPFSLSETISSTPVKRSKIDTKSMSNVKVLIAKLNYDDFSKLGIDIPKAFQQNNCLNKTQVTIQTKHKTTERNEEPERFQQNRNANKMAAINPKSRERDKDPNRFQRNRTLNKAELAPGKKPKTPEKDEIQRFQQNRSLNKVEHTSRKYPKTAEEPQRFQRSRTLNKTEAKPAKNTKTPEKIEEMGRLRPKRKAAPTMLVEPSLSRKLRRT